MVVYVNLCHHIFKHARQWEIPVYTRWVLFQMNVRPQQKEGGVVSSVCNPAKQRTGPGGDNATSRTTLFDDF